MIAVWGHGYQAGVGGSLMPGICMFGTGKRLLERAKPGVLFKDLQACNNYLQAVAAAARVRAPALLVLGEKDLMTPAKAGQQLAASLPTSRTVLLQGGGHMLLSEQPDAMLAAVRELAEEQGTNGPTG